jgi:23S rRNA-/tRNA-specific pseudouridylate synthase
MSVKVARQRRYNPHVPTLSLLQVTPHELVVCKPAGVPSELPRDPSGDSLLTRLRADGFDDLRLVHRLDSPACGVMLVARSGDAAAYYSAEIAARRWHKVYVAEVAAPLDKARELVGDHKAYLATEGRRAVLVRSGGKPSFLTISHAAAASADRSHVLIRLHTGRFHQIRVMLASLGAPLVGDSLYGGSANSNFYLEHVMLAARPFGSDSQQVWLAPPHRDRPTWSASLAEAVAAEHAALLSAV